jgi:hypothetical protein
LLKSTDINHMKIALGLEGNENNGVGQPFHSGRRASAFWILLFGV